MVDGKSLVGLSHSEAVAVLKSTQQLVQLVVATEVSQLLARRSDAFDRGDTFVWKRTVASYLPEHSLVPRLCPAFCRQQYRK